MGIENFIKGVFTRKEGDNPEKIAKANERLEQERENDELEKNNFMIEFGLTELKGYEALDVQDIEQLKQYAENQENIMPEDLKREVQIKAAEIIKKKVQ